jgi:V8-like Glu-specific endopeptidase
MRYKWQNEEATMKRNYRKHLLACLAVALMIFAVGSCTLSITSIQISNNSVYTLAHVYITGHNNPSWGGDLLYPGVITAGSSHIYDVSPGYYDVMVTDTTTIPYSAFAYNVGVSSGSTTPLTFDGNNLY